MLDAIRYEIGRRLYYLGYRIMPARLRVKISLINAIGLHWIDKDCPQEFTIKIDEIRLP